jgi:hypothetical protein
VSDQPYRTPPDRVPLPTRPVEPDPYLRAWRDLRRRNRLVAIAFPAWILASLPAPMVGPAPCFATFVALLCATMHATNFRCPQCGGLFGRHDEEGWKWPNGACFHCGITVGTPKSEAGRVPS